MLLEFPLKKKKKTNETYRYIFNLFRSCLCFEETLLDFFDLIRIIFFYRLSGVNVLDDITLYANHNGISY